MVDRPFAPLDVADAVAVLDATEVGDAVVAGLSCGGRYALALAAHHPDRVRGVVAIAPSVPFLTPPHPWRVEYDFDVPLEQDEGWAKDNRHYWLRDYRGFLEFFFSELFNEPHSTKQIEDSVAWGLDTSLVAFEGSGHCPQAREPVRLNQLIREFADDVGGRPTTPARWFRPRARQRRALYVSSPIGLGHAWRDVAIADQLRRRVPDLEIQWLAQSPVTEVLERRGETIHPASAELASESAHFDREASTNCTCSRRCAGWTRSSARTSWSSTTSSARTPTTCGSATRYGTSITSFTRTPS